MTLTPTVISVSETLTDRSGTRHARGAHAKNQSDGSHGPDWTHSSRRTGPHLDTRVSNLLKGSWKESGTLGNSAQQQQAFPFGPQAVTGKSSHFAGLRGISHLQWWKAEVCNCKGDQSHFFATSTMLNAQFERDRQTDRRRPIYPDT